MPFLGNIMAGLSGARRDQVHAAQSAGLYGGDSYKSQSQGIADVSARTCGAEVCTRGWLKPWKNRRRPVFEDKWGCSESCMKAIVETAVRREVGAGASESAGVPHRHRVPLGLVLLGQGWITHPQLQAALEAQKASGQGRIGDWLRHGCNLDEALITRGLGLQWSCPVLTAERFSPAAMALVMPKRLVAEFGIVPLRVAGSRLLYLAVEDRMDAAAALALEQISALKVESGLLGGTDFAAVRKSLLAADGVPVQMKLVADADALAAGISKVLEERQAVASRLVRVHQYHWLRVWMEAGAMSRVGNLPASTEDVEDHLFIVGGEKRMSRIPASTEH